MNRKSIRAILAKYYEVPLVNFFDSLGFSPNGITILGFVITAGAGILIACQYFLIGGLLMLGGGALDLIDGGLARRKGKASKFGAFLDSVIDRFQEGVVLLALLYYFSSSGCTLVETVRWDGFGFFSCRAGVILAYLTFMASVMVSYLRARAEGLGIKCDIGIMTRPERVAAIGIAICISEWIPETILVVLFLITLLCFFTTIQRIAYSWRNLD